MGSCVRNQLWNTSELGGLSRIEQRFVILYVCVSGMKYIYLRMIYCSAEFVLSKVAAVCSICLEQMYIQVHDMFSPWHGRYVMQQISEDRISYTTVATVKNNAEGWVKTPFPDDTKAMFVRMYGSQRGTCYGYSIYHFKVYGSSVESGGRKHEVDKVVP